MRSFRPFVISAILMIAASITAAQSAPPSVAAAVSKLVKMHQAWGTAISTKDAVLTLKIKEVSKDAAKIDLSTSGLPSDKVYELVSWPVTANAPQTVAEGVTINAKGVPICSGRPGLCTSDTPDDPIDIALPSPLPGEPIRLGLVSADQKIMAFAKIVPVPLHGSDKGCSVDATILTPGAEAVLYEASGFAPGEAIEADSVSASESRTEKKNADADGHYVTVALPYVDGRENVTVTLTLRSAHCAPSVTVAWGKR